MTARVCQCMSCSIIALRKEALRVKSEMRQRRAGGPRVNNRVPDYEEPSDLGDALSEMEIEHPLLGEADGTHRAFDPASLDDDNGGGLDQ